MYFNEQVNPSTELETTRLVKTGPGKLLSLVVYNGDPAAGGHNYVLVFDGNTGGTPSLILPIPNDGYGWFDFGERGYPFFSSIVVALSTTPTTFTPPADDYGWFSPVFN